VVPFSIVLESIHASRELCRVTGAFGKTEITVPRARLVVADGKVTEWHSALRKYQRRTVAADTLDRRRLSDGHQYARVRRALAALLRGAVSRDTMSRRGAR